MWLSGISQWDSAIKSSWVRILTSQCASWSDLRCCQDAKLQQSTVIIGFASVQESCHNARARLPADTDGRAWMHTLCSSASWRVRRRTNADGGGAVFIGHKWLLRTAIIARTRHSVYISMLLASFSLADYGVLPVELVGWGASSRMAAETNPRFEQSVAALARDAISLGL